MRAYNFGVSGRNLTKLYHGMWLIAVVITWTLFFGGGKKMSKIRCDFWQLSNVIANISGTDRQVENRKSTKSTTFYPLLGGKMVNFGSLTKTL